MPSTVIRIEQNISDRIDIANPQTTKICNNYLLQQQKQRQQQNPNIMLRKNVISQIEHNVVNPIKTNNEKLKAPRTSQHQQSVVSNSSGENKNYIINSTNKKETILQQNLSQQPRLSRPTTSSSATRMTTTTFSPLATVVLLKTNNNGRSAGFSGSNSNSLAEIAATSIQSIIIDPDNIHSPPGYDNYMDHVR